MFGSTVPSRILMVAEEAVCGTDDQGERADSDEEGPPWGLVDSDDEKFRRQGTRLDAPLTWEEPKKVRFSSEAPTIYGPKGVSTSKILLIGVSRSCKEFREALMFTHFPYPYREHESGAKILVNPQDYDGLIEDVRKLQVELRPWLVFFDESIEALVLEALQSASDALPNSRKFYVRRSALQFRKRTAAPALEGRRPKSRTSPLTQPPIVWDDDAVKEKMAAASSSSARWARQESDDPGGKPSRPGYHCKIIPEQLSVPVRELHSCGLVGSVLFEDAEGNLHYRQDLDKSENMDGMNNWMNWITTDEMEVASINRESWPQAEGCGLRAC